LAQESNFFHFEPFQPVIGLDFHCFYD